MKIRIGLKFTYKDKTFEITDVVQGAFKGFAGVVIFYRNIKTGIVKVKTYAEFLKKFDV